MTSACPMEHVEVVAETTEPTDVLAGLFELMEVAVR